VIQVACGSWLGYTRVTWRLGVWSAFIGLGCRLLLRVLAAGSLLLFSLCCLLLNFAWLLGVSVRWHPETETKAEHRSSLNLKPKPKTEKTKILVRFGAVRTSVFGENVPGLTQKSRRQVRHCAVQENGWCTPVWIR